jgi:uncharacterized protein (DUF2461 family)
VESIDPDIVTTPEINKTISRIFRDTRFSNDKSPFRTDLWISFKRPKKIWGNVPEFYFYFTPEVYQYGMGFYAATPVNMQNYRQYITDHPSRFKSIADSYHSQHNFSLMGDDYKKHIENPLPDKYQEWLQKRNLHLSCKKGLDSTFFSGSLKDELKTGFLFNARLYHFLTDSINQ